jgi:COMPASS component SPP1
LFTGDDLELGFSHNDLQPSNIIVNAGKIVGIIDWEMSGYFGERAAIVHRRMRCPGKEAFANANLSEEEVEDLTVWNNLL